MNGKQSRHSEGETESLPPLPNFLVVGAMKSGTSTLAAHLRAHPDIYMPRKELHFFNKCNRPAEAIDRYRLQFSGWSGEPHIGEKTPNYSLIPEGPQRIADVLPEVKLIWSFRNPIDRAYSNYWHMVKRGREIRSFEAALKREYKILDRMKLETRTAQCYVMRSDYANQIRRFLEHFDQNQMHYLLFEDLVSSPIDTLQGVMDFLGVEKVVAEPDLHTHKTRLPKVRFIEYLAHTTLGGTRLGNTVTRLNRKKKPGYPVMSDSTRKSLFERFQTWYPEFERLTGLSTSRWTEG